MLAKFVKYALLLEAEVVSMTAEKIKSVSEEFVRKNADEEYSESLDELFDGIRNKVKSFSPQIDKVTNSVNKIKDNILDFPKRVG